MLHRRAFFSTAALAAATAAARASTDGRPPVTKPRATSGDAVEPDWAERLTLTVGATDKADFAGSNEKVLQAAVDYLARMGGGTLKILPGTYTLRNAVYLTSNIRIQGSGLDSILVKAPSVTSNIAVDSDWYDQEITLEDAAGFQLGDGICLRAKNPDNNGSTVLKRTLVARSGKRFKLDKALRENIWLPGKPTVSTLFPILSGENIANVTIENIALDGNKAHNENLDGNYAGCIFLQDCNKFVIRGVTARNYNGDGISWQICHDVLVENCHSHGHTGLGLHPGSGSQRPLIRNNRLVGNDQGLFFCWGVKYGLAENNIIENSKKYGMSIGHRDTDNIIRNNVIKNSAEVGILFRKERGFAYNAHRNTVENNQVIDVVKETGAGIEVMGFTQDIVIRNNQIRQTAAAAQRVGIRLGADAGPLTMAANTIEGFSQAVLDLRKKS
ncbi:MAG: right-handed parallel beta-helix repeat-containing protein [Bryobacterales bacterium]|nr:right-handed parallel beta-helix repeat-containing protein [Bryobacterales bacterium]